MILIIDNYDSFTYNLAHLLMGFDEVLLKFNDEITLDEIKKINPSLIVLSPGPKTPKEAGICLELVKNFKGIYPILGICLGHQIIAQAFGAKIIKAIRPVHGRVEEISHKSLGLFKSLPNLIKVTRYHSLVVDEKTLPKSIEITARSQDNQIMALKIKNHKIEGLQFHPEAILSEFGKEMMGNFINSLKE